MSEDSEDDQEWSDSEQEAGPSTPRRSWGDDPSLKSARQLTIDIVAGIVRDWTYISAGLPGPWTGDAGNPLRKQLDDFGVPKACFEDADTLNEQTRAASHAPGPRDGLGNNVSTDWHLHVDPSQEPENTASVGAALMSWEPRKRRRTSEGMYSGRRVVTDRKRSPSRYREDGHFHGMSKFTHGTRPEIAVADRTPPTNSRSLKAPTAADNYHPSRLPLSSRSGGASVVFLSELVPRCFDSFERHRIMGILRDHATYLPACIVGKPRLRPHRFFGNLADNLPILKFYQSPQALSGVMQVLSEKGNSSRSFPTGKLPVEIIDHIMRYLTRKDVENLRLVCSEFEHKTSSLFRSVVVPFTSEIFDMLHTSTGSGNTGATKKSCGPGKESNNLGTLYNDPSEMKSTLNTSPLNTFPDPAPPVFRDESRLIDWDEQSDSNTMVRDCKGKAKAIALPATRDNTNSRFITKEIGMQVFSGWGPHVVQFAFAFDFFEAALSSLPSKVSWISSKAFWGKFPWPPATYQRFKETERLEQTADRGKHMAEALSYLTNVRELGLSLDSGLGWLCGPDQSDRVKMFQEKSRVFGTRYLRSKTAGSPQLGHRSTSNVLANGIQILSVFARLMSLSEPANDDLLEVAADYIKQNAVGHLGYLTNENIEEYVENACRQMSLIKDSLQGPPDLLQTILENARGSDNVRKGIRAQSQKIGQHLGTPRLWSLFSLLGITHNFHQNLRSPDPLPRSPGLLPGAQASQDQRHLSPVDPNDGRGGRLGMIFDGLDYSSIRDDEPNPVIRKSALTPKVLTDLQKQCLLELSWAQEAMLNSYLLAIMDSRKIAANLSIFTIAKLSSSYLPLLNRADLWAALPNLEKVTLLVSADWRKILKQNDQILEDRSTQPSLAAIQLHDVLQNHVAPSRKIRSIHVGYIGGGEHATGLFGRNQHILPAPISGLNAANVQWNFPHIEDLTFTNCWFTAETLQALVWRSRASCLKSLKLESVSLLMYGGLTYLYPREYHPLLFDSAASSHLGTQTNLAFGVPRPVFDSGQVLNAAASANSWMADPVAIEGIANLNDTWMEGQPLRHSWAELIDSITPGDNLAQLRYNHSHQPWDPPPPAILQSCLIRVQFDSCGYARLPWQLVLPEPHPGPRSGPLRHRMQQLQTQMMESKDLYLGKIVPVVLGSEERLLADGFGMRLGWAEEPKRLWNFEDGQLEGGTGRFSGVLERRGKEADS